MICGRVCLQLLQFLYVVRDLADTKCREEEISAVKVKGSDWTERTILIVTISGYSVKGKEKEFLQWFLLTSWAFLHHLQECLELRLCL